ncbi:mannose-1-phosphate guanylyltransferase/mannose-6-phosphate isomerase [Dongia rigui]|uniref:mannose-1-phosphate guanylyltransferase n=1 Tax=Dongia rigui TaxID=940149 RepID=A0ABU5E345_9PROT|nr:mannose-1-phosphate guanylyltransferase/mannose-6-phosphate isomerase [Dongia rigui]MDY0873792.1 mannose-1-phosphate guanylyltransferase/mannose-6-phosphate isomerase [Dongia rigui]
MGLAPEASREVRPVVLAGGSGMRLWPLSRETFPKQLSPLMGEHSLLQSTIRRIGSNAAFGRPIILTNEALRFAVAEQLRLADCAASIVLEPVGRNTAAAIAVAAFQAARENAEATLLVMPSDHMIADGSAFLIAVERAVTLARQNLLVTFGATPTRPETGFGYIRQGAAIEGGHGYRVASFTEKPSRDVAQGYLDKGGYYWNCGIFVFKASFYLAELKRLAPEVHDAAQAACDTQATDHDFIRIGAKAFAASPDISIDYAVMEKTGAAAVVPLDAGWSDIGSWSEIWNILPKDAAANVLLGDVLAENVTRCYINGADKLVAAVGLTDTIVVATDDAVLVAGIEHAQSVRKITERLKTLHRREAIEPTRVSRPWGFFQSLHRGERFQVKRLTIAPGARISLQMHLHRAEHWVVVNGTALVTHGEDKRLVQENESIYIPAGTKHRLENPGKMELNVIEVQTGSYLEEDDIVRYDDTYGRS